MFSDKRSGKIALVAHCILNQNCRAMGLAEKSSVITEIVDLFACNEIGIIQMSCPELPYAGVCRQPQTKEHYDNVVFRRGCKELAEEIAKQIDEYKKCGIELKSVIGVEGSPSCAVNETPGIFMKELRSVLAKKGISVPFYEIHYDCLEKDAVRLEKLIK